MKGLWSVLIGLGAAVAYGIVSHVISGAWNFSLAFVIGAVVALALSGFRVHPDADSEDRPTESLAPSQPQTPDNAVALSGDCGAAPRIEPASQLALLGECGARALPPTQHHSAPTPNTSIPSPKPSPDNLQPVFPPSGERAEDLWNRAREMAHNEIPDPVEDDEYLCLIISAAECGHVPALAKLGDYAFRRGAFVEAYFWTTMAKCSLEHSNEPCPEVRREIVDKLRNIRREWAVAGQPLEFENVYENFPEERGELGRAFLRLDSGKEVGPTRDYIQFLAMNGNPDAALFMG